MTLQASYTKAWESLVYQRTIPSVLCPKKYIMAQAPQVAGHEHEDAREKDWLRVDDIHEIYYEQYGKKDGKPGKLSPALILIPA
jgi:hypothetical protein